MGRFKDLTGQKFGRLTVIKRTDRKNSSHNTFYLCKCDCGNEKEINGRSLIKNKTKSCGCIRRERYNNLRIIKEINPGDKFNKLTLIKIVEKGIDDGQKKWLCKCECGKEKIIKEKTIISNVTKSCGCLQRSIGGKNKKDWTGKKYYNITFIKPSGEKEIHTNKKTGKISYNIIWRAMCDCGNYLSVLPRSVVNGNTKTCGKCNSVYLTEYPEICKEWDFEKNKEIDIKEVSHGVDRSVWWICSRCGYSYKAKVNNRCCKGSGCPKCHKSKGEEQILLFLYKNNICYELQKRFKDCRYKNTLPFDFYLPDYNLCIEYQGQQHYEEIKRYGKEHFLSVKRNDQIKSDYCKKNDIKLLEICYLDFKNIEKILTKELNLATKS